MWHICMCLSVLCIYVGVCVCFSKENLHATWKLIRLKGLLHSSGSSMTLGLSNGFCGWGVGSWQTNTHTKFGNWSGQTLFYQRFENGSAGRAWSLLLHIPPLCLSISRARHSPQPCPEFRIMKNNGERPKSLVMCFGTGWKKHTKKRRTRVFCLFLIATLLGRARSGMECI